MKVHRWQPTGMTPCGLRLEDVQWNEGQMLSEGVTCLRCSRAKTIVSYVPPLPHPTKVVVTTRLGKRVVYEQSPHWAPRTGEGTE